MDVNEKIVLFDLDGTMCDWDLAIKTGMEALRSPEETAIHEHENEPPYIKARQRLIKSSVDWWANLPKFQLGFDIWDLVTKMGLRKMILTQGPKNNPNAWSGKKIWIDKNLGSDIDVTITRDKGLVYGSILVDDWPEYVDAWLAWRKRGLVIMPASEHNIGYSHPQVIRYDGTNFEEVKTAIENRFKN